MPHVERTGRKRNAWRGVATVGGKRHTKSFSLKNDALKWAVEKSNESAPSVREQFRYDQFVKIWIDEETHHLRPQTLAEYRRVLKSQVLPVFWDRPLNEITREEVASWVTAMSGKLAPDSVRAYFNVFRSSIVAAYKMNYLPSAHPSPVSDISLPSQRYSTRFLTRDELSVLVDATDERYSALVLLLGTCGLRVGEALALRPEDIRQGSIAVGRTLIDKGGEPRVAEPKTKRGKRNVPMTSELAEALSAHMAKYPDPDWVFQAPEGGPVRLHNFRSRVFYPAVKKAKLDKTRLHDLRHTAISIWLSGGADPKSVQHWGGHSSIVTIIDRYGHMMPGEDGEALMKRMDALFAQESVEQVPEEV